jgi:transcriptional regulator with XRE-family HTH domain/uncharacterized phage-associated protein
MPLGSFIRQLREEAGLSQSELAEQLKISRPTVVQLEKGAHELTLTEANKAAEIFGLELSDLLNEHRPAEPRVDLPKAQAKNVTERSFRISVPQKKLDVFEQVLLYVLNKVGAKPNVGETVLNKILYFIDFNFYEKYEEQLIGATYIKNHFGPTPVEFKKIVDKMIADGEVTLVKNKYFEREQKKYLPLKTPDLAALNDGRAAALIDEVLAKYSDLSAGQISEISHRDVPWVTAAEGQPIDYEAVFYRTPEFSARRYEEV